MTYRDLRDFMAQLEQTHELRRISEPVSPHLEMTALCDRVLRAGGPALLFERPTGHSMPVLGNLFGTTGRVARAIPMRLYSSTVARPVGSVVMLPNFSTPCLQGYTPPNTLNNCF